MDLTKLIKGRTYHIIFKTKNREDHQKTTGVYLGRSIIDDREFFTFDRYGAGAISLTADQIHYAGLMPTHEDMYAMTKQVEQKRAQKV